MKENYIKIANLLYPNAKPVGFWEKKYPKRDLPAGAEVTRFAPSPTGALHIGHFFQSLCDMFIARSTGGIFYLRIEDTDKKREIAGSVENAISILNEFGIKYDEGVISGGKEVGKYGPYTQSARQEIYQSYAKYLVENGKAYPCFCDKFEISEIREKRNELIAQNQEIESSDACRNLSFEEISENIKNGKPFALRLKSSGDIEKTFTYFDEVKGERQLRENCKDIVLIKSDGLPVYAFAHAVDDHLMGTTTVIRGEEWYASLSAHLEVFDALGFENVKYAHNPVICKLDTDGNKRKISKRLDPEADMKYFTISGYPKEAILEYLLTLANSNFEIWRAENPSLPMTEFKFSANKISSSNPIFDFNKLKDISKTIIANKTAEEIVADLKNWKINLEKHSPEDENLKLVNVFLKNENYFKNVINIDRGGPKPRKDIAKWEDIFEVFGYMFEEFFYWVEYETQEYSDEKLGHLVEVLKAYKTVFDDADERENWFEKIKNMSQNLGFATNNKEFKQNPQNFKGTVADVCEYIRIALTGKRQSPDLYSIMKVLGNEEIFARIEKCLQKIEKN